MNFGRILDTKTKNITFAAGILAASALISQLLAVFRNNLLATSFPNNQTDIYFAAFRVPDLVYGVLITGGIVASFLPVFSSAMKKSKETAELLTNDVLCVFLLALSFLSIVLAFLAPQFIGLIVPGFDPLQKAATVNLMRIMFLSPILLGMSAIISGVLQYFHLFLVCGLAPIFYNLGIICGILFFYPLMGIQGLAWGVILGAFLHLFCQVPAFLKHGFHPRFVFDLKINGLKKIFKLMLPRTLGAASYHINLIVITSIASTLSVGAISIFNYANYLYGVPVSLIGISFATAVFPTLSRNFAHEQKKEFSCNFTSTFLQILFFIIPLSFLTFVLRAQIVRLLFGTSLSLIGNGYFGWWETRLTAACVGVFAVSLFSASLVPFLARVFFATQDTKTPVKIAIATVGLNVALSYLFVYALAAPNVFQKSITSITRLGGIENISVIGLPLAITLSSIFQFVLLMFFLRRRLTDLDRDLIVKNIGKVVIASFLMIVIAWLSLRVWVLFFSINTVSGIFLQLMFSTIIGVAVFLFVSHSLGLKQPKAIWSLVLSKLGRENETRPF